VRLLLERRRAGDERLRDNLIALSYGELRITAEGLIRRERPDHSLSPTAVVEQWALLFPEP
jgi:hypothetical protein